MAPGLLSETKSLFLGASLNVYVIKSNRKEEQGDAYSFVSVMFVNVPFIFIKMFQDKVKTLEIELDEEKSGAELLNERIARSREQVHRLSYLCLIHLQT